MDVRDSKPLSTWTCDELLSRLRTDARDSVPGGKYRLAEPVKARVLAIIEEQKFDGTDLIMLYSEARALRGEELRAVMAKSEWLPVDFRRINQIEARKNFIFTLHHARHPFIFRECRLLSSYFSLYFD